MTGDSNATVAVALEQRFAQTPDRRVWTPGMFAAPFWSRYLRVFDRVRVIARAEQVQEIPKGWSRVDRDRVRVAPLPHYIGPDEYLVRRRQVHAAVASALDGVSAFILRVPGTIGTLVWRRLEREGRPYGLEVVGDPFDVYSPGAEAHPLRPLFRIWFAENLRRQCAGATAVSYVTSGALQRRYPAARGIPTTHYSSVQLGAEDFAAAPPEPAEDGEPIRLVTVGSLAQMYKGVDVLIEAVRLCVDRGVELELVVVGDGRHRGELEQLSSRLGLSSRISFTGHLEGLKRVREQLDRAHVFVLASRQEGLPRAMIEAMARGLPCIGTRVGGIPELLPDSGTVPPGDARALADAIRELSGDRARMRRAAARNLERARSYGDDVLMQRRIRFYRQVLDATQRWRERRASVGRGRRLVYMTTDPNAARWFLRGQLAFMRDQGFDVTVIASPGEDLDVVRRREQVRTVPLSMRREIAPLADLVSLWRLVREFRRDRPDLLNAATPKAGLLGMLAAAACGVPSRVYTLGGLRLETTAGAKRIVLGLSERTASAIAQRVICVSHSLERAYLDGGYTSPDKTRVIAGGSPNGVDVARFTAIDLARVDSLRSSLGIPTGAPVLGFVGRFTRDKGLTDFAAVFERVRELVPRVRALLVGDFEDGDPVPAEVARQLLDHPRVVVTGFVPDEEMPLYYELMSVLVMPSRREGFGMAALEAAAASRPVVGYAVTGLVDAVEHQRSGALVPLGDTAALADAALAYLSDRELAAEHGRRGRERAIERFDQRELWQGLLAQYGELLQARAVA